MSHCQKFYQLVVEKNCFYSVSPNKIPFQTANFVQIVMGNKCTRGTLFRYQRKWSDLLDKLRIKQTQREQAMDIQIDLDSLKSLDNYHYLIHTYNPKTLFPPYLHPFGPLFLSSTDLIQDITALFDNISFSCIWRIWNLHSILKFSITVWKEI